MDFYEYSENLDMVEVRRVQPSEWLGEDYRHYHTGEAIRAEVIA